MKYSLSPESMQNIISLLKKNKNEYLLIRDICLILNIQNMYGLIFNIMNNKKFFKLYYINGKNCIKLQDDFYKQLLRKDKINRLYTN